MGANEAGGLVRSPELTAAWHSSTFIISTLTIAMQFDDSKVKRRSCYYHYYYYYY